MTAEQKKKLEVIYDSLPDALSRPEGSDYKYINKQLLFSIVDHMIISAVYEAKIESLDEFKTIVDETFN
jgi:hypothetical protein